MSTTARPTSISNESLDQPLLTVSKLSVFFERAGQRLAAVRDVSFEVNARVIVALVGESGCGKSLTARAILRLPPPSARIAGSIVFDGQELTTLPEAAMRSIRGRAISMIFQEPQTALNPVLTVGKQAAEVLETHSSYTKQEIRERVWDMFTQVGIPNARSRYGSYPHELSGGMRQRVMIAMSLLAGPKLLLADEPTTALDATIRQQILLLLRHQSEERGLAILCISHDLDLVRSFAAVVGVMYAGRLVEIAPVEELFAHPLHPYTQGLLRASPATITAQTKRLPTIPGVVPSLSAMPDGCPFAPRCFCAEPACSSVFPDMVWDAKHAVACLHPL